MITASARRFVRLLNENVERYLLVVTYFYITLIIVVGVFNRFALASVSGWEQETARLLFIWLTWLGASLAIRKRSHIRIDFLYQYVSNRTEGLLYIFSDLVVIGFCVVAFNAFMPVIESTMTLGAGLVTLQISQIFFQMVIPVGLGLMTLRAFQMLIRDVRDTRNGREVYKGERLFEAHADEEA